MKLCALAAVGAVVVSGVVVRQAAADSPPQRVLQSVRVEMGPDGTIFGIRSTNVRKVEGRAYTSDEHDYDPAKTVRDLPVRVVTSYRAGNRSGSDLRDLRGYTGPLQIDLTVQNTTVHPEPLSYDQAGARRQQYALVGVPLTVVASADLGPASLRQVVTQSDTGAPVTNGVLSQTSEGVGHVQWASLLAPPQLAPSATFSLVEDAKNFQVPSFDLGVQLGLATDDSTRSLVHSAFGDGGSSQLRLESDTIKLIGRVASVLADAGSQLNSVKEQLHFSAGTLGTRTVGDLTSSTQTVAASTKQLSGELSALASDLSAALNTTNSAAVAQMRASVQAVQALLGDTASPPAAPTVTGSGCTTEVTNKPQANSVYGQLNEVITQLNGLSSATGRCSDTIRASLLATIGSNDPTTCTTVTSAICTISSAADVLTGVMSSLQAESADAATLIDQNGVTNETNTAYAALATTISSLQSAAADLKTKGSQNDDSTQAIKAELDRIHGEVIAAQGALDARINDLGDRLAALHAEAAAGLQEMGADPAAAGSIQAQAAQLGAAICDLHSSADISDQAVKQLRDLTTGTDCANQDIHGAGPDPLVTRLGAQAAKWKQLADDTDPTSSPMAAVISQLAGLRTSLATIATDLSNLSSTVNDNVQGGINQVVTAIAGLYDTDPATTDPVTALGEAIGGITGRQADLKSKITAAFNGYQTSVGAERDTVQAQIPVVDAQRRLSETDISTLFATASGGLTTAADTIAQRGKASIDAQNANVGAQTVQFQKLMDRSVSSALTSIDSSVRSSNADLGTAEKILTGDLQNVLIDLGSRGGAAGGGRGLLGIIQQQEAQTQTSTARLGTANQEASQFGNVRAEDLGGVYLQQAQLQRALDLQAAFPAFTLDLPNGSQHVTVYSFHVRGVR
ncbi:hypothetical protein [Oryzihumus leptocrescens]|uniref:hypothetical protein n=1 Tax=Oryzihumus leptocrescens TaxID=297536 RepID=UPI0011543714|nr:hypothetical protein [Oryzihumus leptocrescens]